MRNWPKMIPGASFKGFPFHVDDEGIGGSGRLVALHPYTKAEVHGTEDMGRKARAYHVTAYIVGDDADATRACAPSSASPVLTRAYSLAGAMCVAVEAACLGEAFLCEARTEFGDRQAASAARDRITAALDGAIDRVATALGQPAAFVLSTAAGQTCAHLVDLSGSLQPLIRAQAGRSFPSTALAWSLYADPTRAPELVARNRVGTPFHMPATFEALAPKV